MQVVTIKPRIFFDACRNSLRSYVKKFLLNRKNEFTQPLLSSEELTDLQLRMNSRNIQLTYSHDTAEQRMGDKQSIHRGYGLDYEESRIYQPGDDPRYMNWKLAARTGELYMKVFREERRPGVFVLLDRRKTMLFGTRTRLKVTQAARVASCIVFSAQQRHSSIGAIVLEAGKENPRLIKETNDKQTASELIRAACKPCPPITDQFENTYQSTKNECGFERALNILQETLIPGSTLYLVGDFIDLKEEHRSKLMQLSAHNDVHAIHIIDPSEQDLPKVGPLHFYTAENKQGITMDTADSSTHKAYKRAATHFLTERKKIFSALNITYKEVSTDSESIELFIQ